MKFSVALFAAVALNSALSHRDIKPVDLKTSTIQQALSDEGLSSTLSLIEKIEPLFEHAVAAQQRYESEGESSGSLVGQDAVEIASTLDLDPRATRSMVIRAIKKVAHSNHSESAESAGKDAWRSYFQMTANLESDPNAAALFQKFGFSPVKISWEDIDRDEGSSVGGRISDVGIWGREDKDSLDTARLMLTVRRDQNFRDKVLMVPASNIKLHKKVDGKMVELTLADRLKELGLLSPSGRYDKNVIVSNQFSLVPVPQKEHVGVDTLSFNFSIFPYGSTNYVIADTIEGSSDVIVGPGNHQLVYFNANGKKAPFTAARASDRPEVVAAAKELRAQGMDVDVQRFYLIQIPIRHDATGVTLGNMGTPPVQSMWAFGGEGDDGYALAGSGGAIPMMEPPPPPLQKSAKMETRGGGVEEVVVGHGEEEGEYRVGSGFRGKRADERVRVTVCYFVTPHGELTQKDMEQFATKFQEWDKKAIWGGSFVVPEETNVAAK